MPWTDQEIGPHDPIVNLNVGRFLSSGNPGPGDIDCISEFLRELRRRPVRVACEIVGATIIICTCNHVITLLNFGQYLDDIRSYP